MANENLHIDENTRWVLGAITNDSNEEIRNARINPATGRLVVEAVIASTNTSIGGTIPGGTPGSVLFIGPGSTLDQDNPNLFYDYTNFFLGLGTNTPDATLTVDGSVHFDLGGDATGDIFYRDAGGFLAPLGIGTAGQVLTVAGGLPSWQTSAGATGYDTVQDNGTPLTQRSTMNFVNYFDVTDVSSVTTININTTELGGDQFLGTALSTNTYLTNGLLANNTFMTGIANNSTFLSALLLNSTFISGITNIVNTSTSISINLATQVTGVLPVANIDVVGIANDSSFLAALIPNLDENVKVAVDGITIIGDGTTANPLTATGSTGNFTITATAEQDLIAGQPVGMSASLDDKVALALITKYINANLVSSASISNICEIAQDKYVVLYEDASNFPSAFVAQVNRSTMSIAVGNTVTFSQGGARVAKLDTDKYVIVYYRSGTGDIQDEVFSVSGTTSASLGINTYGSASGPVNSITSAGTDRIVYTRRDGFTPTGSKMVAITYSGATGSAGSTITLDANTASIYIVSYVDTNTVMSVQNTSSGSSTGVPCSIYTVTGNTFGSPTGTTVGTVGSNSSRSVGVSVVSPGVFLLRAQRTTSPVFSNLYLCHLSGSSIVTDQTSATDSDAVSGNLTPIGVSGKVYETCYTGVTATNRINEITVSGTTFTNKVASIGITFENAPLILLDSTNGYYYATNWKSATEIGTNIQGMSNNFVGIAQSTVSRGSTLSVLIKGVDTNQSGLSAGNTYIVSNGAFVLSGDPTLPNKGIATSQTSIEI